MPAATGAVSYTHLDVYKRQILDTGGRVARFEARYGKKAATK